MRDCCQHVFTDLRILQKGGGGGGDGEWGGSEAVR